MAIRTPQKDESRGVRLKESRRVMGDRRISSTLKGTVFTSCATPAYMYGVETMELTEKQQEKVQVCENNWIRRIMGVKTADKN